MQWHYVQGACLGATHANLNGDFVGVAPLAKARQQACREIEIGIVRDAVHQCQRAEVAYGNKMREVAPVTVQKVVLAFLAADDKFEIWP